MKASPGQEVAEATVGEAVAPVEAAAATAGEAAATAVGIGALVPVPARVAKATRRKDFNFGRTFGLWGWFFFCSMPGFTSFMGLFSRKGRLKKANLSSAQIGSPRRLLRGRKDVEKNTKT